MKLLHRTSFDEGFEPYEGQEHLLAPIGWHVTWLPGDKPGPVRPEIQPEIKSRGDRGIHTGENGVKLAHAFAFFDAALYRSYAATPGTIYAAKAWCTAESGGGLACQIGIDPTGSPNMRAQGIAWSHWYGTDDPHFEPYKWATVAAQAQATGQQITVFLRCACRDAVQVNAGFFDDLELYANDNDPPAGDLFAHLTDVERAVQSLRTHIEQNQQQCILV